MSPVSENGAPDVLDEDLEAWRESREDLSLQALKGKLYEDPKSNHLSLKSVPIFVVGGLFGAFLWWIYSGTWFLELVPPAIVIYSGAFLVRGLLAYIPDNRVRQHIGLIPNVAIEGSKFLLRAIPLFAGLYALLGIGIAMIGVFWFLTVEITVAPPNLRATVVYLTFLMSLFFFAYLLQGPLRSISFWVIEEIDPGDHQAGRGFVKWVLLHAHRGVLLLAFGVVLIVNLEIVSGSPFLGEVLAELRIGEVPARWIEKVWPSLRRAINAAMLTFLALDAYVTVYHPDWIRSEE